MKRAVGRLFRAMELLIAACLAVMVVMVFGNVVLRYGFNSGILVSEEVSRWLFLWVTFLGAILALRERAHLGSDFLISRLPRLGKQVCLVVGHVLMLIATWMIFAGAWAQAKINLDVEAPVTGAPMAVVYATGVVFAVFAGLLLLGDLWRLLTGRLDDEELVMISDTEEKEEVATLQEDHFLPQDAATPSPRGERDGKPGGAR